MSEVRSKWAPYKKLPKKHSMPDQILTTDNVSTISIFVFVVVIRKKRNLITVKWNYHPRCITIASVLIEYKYPIANITRIRVNDMWISVLRQKRKWKLLSEDIKIQLWGWQSQILDKPIQMEKMPKFPIYQLPIKIKS